MVQRIAALMTVVVCVLLAALVPVSSLAFQVGGAPPILYRPPAPLGAPPSMAAQGQRIAAMIELAAPTPLGAATTTELVERRQVVAAQQALLDQRLAALNVPVLFQTTLAYNGIAVAASADQFDALRALPGVVGVHVIPPKQRSNAAAVPFVGAPAVWGAPGGATGTGIRIGIIDSGIDYTHADFGGPGTTQAYSANNRALIEPGSFPTAKVSGGYDFAGDAYDASGAAGSPIPAPDPDPLDCNGHGTHVAGTAAGFGVAADGSTYHGPYLPGMDFASFRVGPGVAPDARLYALKVFGCQGSTALMTLAIERALDPNGDGDPSDHLDVINISLGSPFGSDDDPDSVALDNAVRAGVVAVVAAGDTGNTFYATDAPASAQLAIAVGASIDPTRATALAPADSLASFSSRGPQRGNGALKPDLTAPGVEIRSAAYGTGGGSSSMSGTSMAAAQVAGAAALLRQLYPHWTPEQIKAALMNTAVPLRAPDGSPYPPSLGGAGRLDMSRLALLDMLAYADDGDAVALTYGAPWVAHSMTSARLLRLENRTETARSVTLSATTTVAEPGVTIGLPSGPISVPPHGATTVPVSITVDPGALDFMPDATTPISQDNLLRYFLAEHGGYVEVNSGASVRVRAAHAAHLNDVDVYLDQQLLDDSLESREVAGYRDTTPGMHTVRVLRSHGGSHTPPLLTAQVQLQQGHDYTLVVVGRMRALGIVAVDETAPAPPPAGQALLHFVNANRVEPNWNIGPLDVYLDGVLKAPALAVGETSAYMPVSPGVHTARFFRAGADPAGRWVASRTFVASAGQLILVGSGRHDDDDADLHDHEQRTFIGYGLLRSSETLRVPFQIFPKSASEAHATSPSISVPPSAQAFTVGLSNTGARNAGLTGSVAGPQTPLVSAFELEAASPPIAGLTESLRAADVQYLGVTNNFSMTLGISRTAVFFGLSSYAPWSTPNEVQFMVYIDSNLDGVDDYLLVNTSQGMVTTIRRPTDVFFSPLYKILANGSLQSTDWVSFWGTFMPPTAPPGFDTAPFNTAVIVQAVGVRLLNLPPGQTRFRYHIETRARDANFFRERVDRIPAVGSLEYDIMQPAVAPLNIVTPILEQRPLFLDVDGGQITGMINPTVLAARHSQRLLVLHHHNAPPTQAEVVEVQSAASSPNQSPGLFRMFLPVVRR